MLRLCDWEEIGDEEDVRLNQQGDMIVLKTQCGDMHSVYFNHKEDRAYVAFPENTDDEIKKAVVEIINALGYEPVAV